MIDAMTLALLMTTATPLPPAPQAVPIKNPAGVGFLCPDHDRDNEHELDIVNAGDGSLVQTLLLGDPPAGATGEIVASINVQPIAFGQYRFVLRAVAGTLKSENSVPSDIWERVPGRPSNVVPK